MTEYEKIEARRFLSILTMLLSIAVTSWMAKTVSAQTEVGEHLHMVQPGDSWTALSWQYGVGLSELHRANPHPNRQRQPTIGRMLTIPNPENSSPSLGYLQRRGNASLLTLAVTYGASPWKLTILNDLSSPFRPLLWRSVFVPGGDTPVREWPSGIQSFELSEIPAQPGQALAIRGEISQTDQFAVQLAGQPVAIFRNDSQFVGIIGTGAFHPVGDHELVFLQAGRPQWSQPWRMVEEEWTYQQITLTGAAAAIDQESIRQERERLFVIWEQITPWPQWHSSFDLPIQEYLEISSTYGARRSYNGGPYRTYHEGVDFSAYAGTVVTAPAAGTVVLAEELYVRGGAVIIDHGLGVYSGLYHLSEVTVESGEEVTQGQLVGLVGTTGLSTGNHLHWDLLAAGTWVDAAAWLEGDLACWIVEGFGLPCTVDQS